MSRSLIASALLVMVAMGAPDARAQSRGDLDRALERNKDVVEWYLALVNEGDVERLREIVDPDYIEHASYAPDGRDAHLAMVADNASTSDDGVPHERTDLIRMIAEGSEVWTYSRVDRAGTIMARIDMFRLDDGQIAEHWAVREDIALDRVNANDQWAVGKGPQDADTQPTRTRTASSPAALERNKQIGRLFFQYTEAADLSEREKLREIAAPDYIQHNAGIRDGIDLFLTRSEPLPNHLIVRMLAEGGYVWCLNIPSFADGAPEGIERVNFNQWRIQDGRLAEHWGTYETAPADRPHTNDWLGYGRTHTRDFSRVP